MSDLPASPEARALLAPRKLIIQLVGFAVGIGLLVWIIRNAVRSDAVREELWERIANADPRLVAALLGFTLVSVLLNGTSFWVTIQPIKPVRFWDLQRINVLANMLNYAPVRLGAIARVLYHVRVDGLSILQVAAWFMLLGGVLVLGIGSCVAATIVHAQVDWIWFSLVAALMVLGALVGRIIAGRPIIVRYGRGLDRMASDARSLWSAVALRCADLGALTGRMAVAAAILDIDLTMGRVVVLAMVALAASLVPFGRLGIKEAMVAATGHMLVGGVEANLNHMSQLALVESAGAILVYVPVGRLALPWFRRRWQAGSWKREKE